MVDLAADIAFTGRLAAVMAPRDINGLGRLLGSLEAQVAALTSTLANLTARWESQEEKANEGRRVMHEKIDACRSEIGQLTYEVSECASRLTSVEGWQGARERERIEHAAQKKLLDRINGKVWACISGLAMLIGGLLAALAIELAKRYM